MNAFEKGAAILRLVAPETLQSDAMKLTIQLLLISILAWPIAGEAQRPNLIAFVNVNVAIQKREKYIAIRDKIVKAIYDAGGRVMAGSDTPEWLMLYGYTLHLEMIDLRDAGLSNYAALESATRNPALFFGTLTKTGTIEKGKRADLVLLDANPLEDIANTQKRAGVMVRGRYFSQTETNQWLDEIAPRFQHALDGQK